MTWWVIVINALLPLLLAEALDWFPWLAERVIRRAAGVLPADERDRYEREWLADVDSLPGRRFSKLVFALSVALVAAPSKERRCGRRPLGCAISPVSGRLIWC